MKKQVLAFLGAALLMFTAVSSVSCDTAEPPQESVPQESENSVVINPTYTYNDYLEESPSTWSPFNWKTDEVHNLLSRIPMVM